MTAQQECLQLPLAEMESTISPPVFGDEGEYGHFDMRLNDEVICTANPDHSNGGLDFASGSCSSVVSLVAGNVYFRMYYRIMEF